MCLGLPSYVISIAENQILGCKVLDQAGLINYLGDGVKLDSDEIAALLNKSIWNSNYLLELSLKNKLLVDARGVQRVLEFFNTTSKSELWLRSTVPQDLNIYFSWANDSDVRSNAINSEAIDFKSHTKWFSSKINNSDAQLFVLMAKNLPVGQIRFECDQGVATIDYSLDEFVRGRGWSIEMLKLGMSKLDVNKIKTVCARVKVENKASVAVFNNLNFELNLSKSNNEFFLFEKHLTR